MTAVAIPNKMTQTFGFSNNIRAKGCAVSSSSVGLSASGEETWMPNPACAKWTMPKGMTK